MLELPTVTLCAATSVNVEATVAALRASIAQVRFADVLLLTDAHHVPLPPSIRLVGIDRLESGSAYSSFLLNDLVNHIATDHLLVVQWDGYVLSAEQWDPKFLEYDYIGAPWPQFSDGHDVGNGGFSLRSRRLLEACRDPDFGYAHPEDVAIGRLNRTLLEGRHGCRFAPRDVAARFAFERRWRSAPTFGFHGVFNMVPLVGADAFWATYRSLDDRSTVYQDLRLLLRQLGAGPRNIHRCATLILDWLKNRLGRESG